MYKVTNALKIIISIILALIVIFLVACWFDIAKNAGPNPTFADWNIIVNIFRNA